MPYVDKRTSTKKEEISSYIVYDTVSLGKMAGKAEPFSWWTCSQIFRKIRRLEILQLFWMMLSTVFAHL